MANQYLRAGDVINGQEGTAQAIINGQVENLFMIKSLEATIEKNKEEIRALGRRGVQSKTSGWSGSGTMTIYYTTSLFRRLVLDYIKTGRDIYFDLIVTNDDPSTTVGKQSVALHGCNLDSVLAAKLDTEAAALDEEVSFTFDDVDLLEQFTAPANLA